MNEEDSRNQADRKVVTELALRWTEVQFEVSSFVAALIPDFHDAHDVVQQVAVVVINKFDRYDQERPFRDWVLGIAKYEVLKYRERQAHEKLIFSQALIDRIAEAYRRPENSTQQVYQALKQCLRQVRGRNRRALQLWYTERMEAEQIAEWLGMKRNALYVMLHRVRASLRECVERRLAWGEKVS